MTKRILSLLLTLIMVVGLLPATGLSASAENVRRISVVVSSSDELEMALALDMPLKIIITEDFTLDRTFYITNDIILQSNEPHKLTRSKYFVDDIFVVGEDSEHRNPVLDGKEAILTLGNPDSDKENLLILDGNRDNMLSGLKVSGTVLFVVNSAVVNFYPNASIVNCRKELNSRTLEYSYPVSYPSRIGGAAAIVVAGTLNIYGGNISNNASNEEDVNITNTSDPDYRISSQGGAIYNYGNVKIYAGTFENNHCSRGGVIYNYKKLKIFGGSFLNNTSSRYGGAIYCPDSQYSNLIMGDAEGQAQECETPSILFKGNSATATGGAIFGMTKSGIVIYENANVNFEENRTVNNNGGAIATSGALTIKGGTSFIRNDSNSKGGAIYLSNSREDKITRIADIEGAEFIDNTAARGGAVGLTAKAVEFFEGGIANFRNCTFRGNKAVEKTAFGNTEPDTSINGGAMYISRKSTLTVDSCKFINNEATLKEGGGIYVTAQSTVTITDSLFDGNRAGTYEEGCGGALATHGSNITINDTEFVNNISDRHGAALYCSYKNLSETEVVHSRVLVDGCSFSENVSGYHGGSVYATSKEGTAFSDATFVQITDTTFSKNSARNNGGGVYLTKSAAYIKNCSFSENTVHALASDNGKRYGGAGIYVTASEITVDGTVFENNSSDFNGGALEAHTGSVVITNKVTATGNQSVNHGAAFYINKSSWTDYDGIYRNNHAGTYGGGLAVFTSATAKLYNTVSEDNVADLKGGGIFFFGESDSYLENVTVQNNTANGTDTSCGGGGIYITGTRIADDGTSVIVGSRLEFNGCNIISNKANKGGAIAAFSEGHFILNNCTVKDNTAEFRGGAIYSSSGNFEAFDTVFENNQSTDYGGAIGVPSNPVQCVLEGCKFIGNKAGTDTVEGNGGAIWWYSKSEIETEFTKEKEAFCVISDTEFTGNEASKYGGAIAVQNGSHLQAFNVTATENKAVGIGGFMYVSTSESAVEIDGLNASGNLAGTGNVIYTYQEPKLTVNTAQIYGDDSGETLTSPNWVITNYTDASTENVHILTYKRTAETQTYTEPVTPFTEKEPTEEEKDLTYSPEANPSVDEIFALGEGTPANSKISSVYSALAEDNNTLNFHGRSQTVFSDINGKTVMVENFIQQVNDAANISIYPIGIMIYQAMLYKRNHPDEDVAVHFSSFRLCEEVAVNINPQSKYYGYMRNLVGKEFDRNGFVRISYLMVEAAKMGIDVTVIGENQGKPFSSSSDGFEAYFTGHLSDACDSKYVTDETKTVGDYMKFRKCEWTAYTNSPDDGDLPASDMMHTKICAVSNYTDFNGVDHGCAVWLGSANLDGVSSKAVSGNNKVQTASVISGHDEIYRVAVNYLNLVADYCNQEGIKDFRELVSTRNQKQIKALLAGETVPEKEQIVYLGTQNDKTFELYFTPLGGDVCAWDTQMNPYAKYVTNLANSDDYILFAMNNVKFSTSTYSFARTMQSMINEAFTSNPDKNNRVFIMARQVKDDGTVNAFDGSGILSLKVGEEIGFASVNKKLFSNIHNKDMLFSYSLDGKREYVSVISSINYHLGASYYQSNQILVIKEKDGTNPDSVFYNVAKYSTNGIVENNIAKATASLSETSFVYNGSSQKPSVTASVSAEDYEVVYPSDTVSVGSHTVTLKGTGIGTGTKKLTYTITPIGTEIEHISRSGNSLEVSWKAMTETMPTKHITGYELQYGTDSTFTNAQTVSVSGYSKTSASVSNIADSAPLYVRIRTYITISGKNYYSDWSSAVCEYDFAHTTTALASTIITYTGKAVQPKVVTAVPSEYYSVSYPEKSVNVGTYSATVTGNGIAQNSVTLTYTVRPKGTKVKNLSVPAAGSLKINWTAQTEKMGSSTVNGYQIQYDTSNTFKNAKTVTVSGAKTSATTIKNLKKNTQYYVRIRTFMTVSGKKYYSSWSSVCSKYNLAQSGVKLYKTEFTYTGKAVQPTVSGLLPTSYYTVTMPKNAVGVGKYTVTVKDNANPSNTLKLTFSILPKGTSLKKLSVKNNKITVTWTAQKTKMKTSVITGYELQYSTSAKFTASTTKTVKVTGATSVSKTLSGLKSGTVYYVRIRTYKTVSDNTYASAWSASKTVKTAKK